MALARAHCTLFSLLAPSPNNITRTPPLILLSSIPSSRPSKTTHRKNHLRPKIHKIKNPKPYSPTLSPPPQEPLPPPPQEAVPIILCPESPEEEDIIGVEVPAGEIHGEDVPAVAADKLEELQVSEATVEHKGISGKVSASTIFKVGGVCLVGAFVYQVICSVLFVVNFSSREKGGNLEVYGREKREFLFNGNNGKSVPVNGAGNVFAVMSQILMEKKVDEIKLMAREARRIEGKKKEEEEDEDEDYGSDDDISSVSSPKLGIEREISARLMKLQNRINSNKDSSAAVQINRLGNSAKSAGGGSKVSNKNVNQENEPLMFKKKLKFKSPLTKETKAPKGFTGIRDSKASDTKRRSSDGMSTTAISYAGNATDRVQISHEDKEVSKQGVETEESISSVPPKERGESVDDESKKIQNNGRNLEGKTEAPEARVKTKNIDKGGVQETSLGVSAVDVKSRESRELSTQKSHGFLDENQDSNPVFEKDVVHNINGSSRHGLARKNSAANSVKVKQANAKTDLWWLNLRYVLVILMQRGSNGGAKGLYSLNVTSEERAESDDSYTVAFEDHADANNFCFLLESFFQDLGDVTADVVPMSIQEVKEDIISHGKKVLVVKKRQLRLFAGQPLADVEKALCSLIQQDQNVL